MTTNSPASATEDSGVTLITNEHVRLEETKDIERGFLKAARRDLTLEEAAAPGSIRWLQYETERLDKECSGLRSELRTLQARFESLTTEYHNKRVELEKLQASSRVERKNEYLTTLAIAVGGAGLGLCPNFLSVPTAHDLASGGLVVFGILFVCGLALRIVK